MRFLKILLLVISTSAFAEPKISPIFDGEFDMDGAACWLEDSQSSTILYDNYSEVKIKIDSKIISLKANKTLSKSTSFECGQTYKFSSSGDDTNVEIKMDKSKSKNCKAKMTVSSPKGKSTLKGLRLTCSK